VRKVWFFFAATAAAACAGRTPAPPASAPARAAVAASAAEPATLRYALGTGRYRLESTSHVEQEMMGQVNSTDITTAALLTAAVADTQGNLGVEVTIDSLAITTPLPGTPDPADLAAATGKKVRLVFSPTGRPISMTAPDSANVALQQLALGLKEFLPLLPEGTLAPGTTWTDTVSTTTPSSGIAVTVHSAREHRVAGWEDHGGTRALHIATTAKYTLSGSGEVQGQELELAGGGQSTADHFVSAAGVYLGSTVSDSALFNASVVSAGLVVPIRRTTRSTFTRLP
jgi:hypothetical protein